VAHIYTCNAALVAPLTVHILQLILDRQWCSLGGDGGCNRLELVHDVHQLYFEWLLAPLSSAVVASHICVLQNAFVIIIGTKGLVLDGHHLRRSGFLRWHSDCGIVLAFRRLGSDPTCLRYIKNQIY
jgi:hypothetical protein